MEPKEPKAPTEPKEPAEDLRNIGAAAQASGVSAKLIRHYEAIGLIAPAARTAAGYRLYGATDIRVLRFIRQSRRLGFSMKQIADLLALWQNRRRSSSTVKKLALDHIAELDARIRELSAMKVTLETLAAHCGGNDRPECPILDNLAQTP